MCEGKRIRLCGRLGCCLLLRGLAQSSEASFQQRLSMSTVGLLPAGLLCRAPHARARPSPPRSRLTQLVPSAPPRARARLSALSQCRRQLQASGQLGKAAPSGVLWWKREEVCRQGSRLLEGHASGEERVAHWRRRKGCSGDIHHTSSHGVAHRLSSLHAASF